MSHKDTQYAITSSANQRIQYWDIAKGIAIMLMILGHTEMPSIFRAAIFSFHMPFFVIANGFFIKSYDRKRTFFRSVRTLLLPYVITCLASAVLYTLLSGGKAQPASLFIFKIKAMIGGMSKISTRFHSFDSVWVVWFVCTLFITRNLYVWIMGYFQKRKWLAYGIICILAYVGYWIGKYYAFLPWSLDVALVSLIFIATGDWMHRNHYFDRNVVCTFVIPLVVWVGIMLIFRCYIELAVRSYPGGILSIIEAIAGSIVLISFSRYAEAIPWFAKFFAWAGERSMIILGLHCLEMMYFNWGTWLFAFLPLEMNWFNLFLAKSILILLFTYIISAWTGTLKKNYALK